MFNVIPLLQLIDKLPKEKVIEELLKFSCPLDQDIENFIHNKAYDFETHDLSRTFLIYNGSQMCGIFTLAMSEVEVNATLTNKQKKELFGTSYSLGKRVPAHLIGQISKNFIDEHNNLIEGKEILELAENHVNEANELTPAPLIRIDCKDEESLKSFYEENGFQHTDELTSDNENLLMYLIPLKNINQQSS